MKKSLLTIILICLSAIASANQPLLSGKIKGKIITDDKKAVSFATIYHKESKQGTIADADGNFTFEDKFVNGKGTLVISAIGYKEQVFTIDIKSKNSGVHTFIIKECPFNLDQVTVYGINKPTPVDSSIYKVKLISKEKIRQSGAANLSELLISEANIRMSTDLVLGSRIEMMGMNGQNVKVMIDGVPVIGRLNGNIDLSQVKLENIAQVEVIEGPMSVIYGNNALAGTINLITKQNKYHALEAQLSTYVESVGRYNGDLQVSKKMGNHSLAIDGGYEHFSGVDFDKQTRSMDWKPKDLHRAKLTYAYSKKDWRLYTKAGYYKDKLFFKGNILEEYKIFDAYYYTDRYDLSGGITGSWSEKNHLNVVTAYNYYKRSSQDYFKDLRTLEKTWDDKITSQVASQIMFRGIFTHTFVPNKLVLQSGIDINIEEMEGPRIKDNEQSLGDYAGFINIKYKPFSSFEFQPGMRLAHNTKYDAPLVYSFNTKWDISENFIWRASFAKGFRAPSIKELFYEFVNSNHEIYGNKDLKAESSYNYNTTFEYNTKKKNHAWKISGSLYYNDIKNMITLIQKEGSTGYQYNNIVEFESIGGDLEIVYTYKTLFQLRGGYGLTGRLNSYTKENGSERFNLTHDFFAGLKIKETGSGANLNIDYKYNGKIPFFYTDTDSKIKEGSQDPFHIMNISLSKRFLKHRLNATLGVKNLFNEKTIKQNRNIGGSAHSSSSGVPVSYGRSFFLNLSYKIIK